MKKQKESYFKRIKKPITSIEEGLPLIRETRNYFLISLGVFVLFAFLGGSVEFLMIIAMVAAVPTAYFGLMWYAGKRSLKRFANLHCECGVELVSNENTTWKEVKREWHDSNNGKSLESKLYVTVEITCKCPKCGKMKTFKERLCSGAIKVSDARVKDSLVSTQSLVDDYFAGTIHA